MQKTRTVLVTGGCGFIGANFVRLLRAKRPEWRLINLDKLTYAGNLNNLAGIDEGPGYRFVRADIGDAAAVEALFAAEPIDTVVHFAAESHVDRSITGPAAFIATNIGGTFTLLEAARKSWSGAGRQGADSRFLHISTDEVYGSLGEEGYFSETTAYDPRSPYSASKAASDHLVNAYFHTYGLPTLITNCSNNYGPYQFPEKLVPLMILNALEGKPLPVYGDGQNVRDWLYVVDHCAAIWTVMNRGETGRVYCVGGRCEKPNLDVVHRICDGVDKLAPALPGGRPRRELITFVKDRPGHDRRYAIDCSRIEQELGWRPAETFDSGFEKTVRWYLENRAWIDGVRSGAYRQWIDQNYTRR